MFETEVNVIKLETLEIEKLRKINKNGLNKTVKKFKTSVIEEILKNHTTLLECFWKTQN